MNAVEIGCTICLHCSPSVLRDSPLLALWGGVDPSSYSSQKWMLPKENEKPQLCSHPLMAALQNDWNCLELKAENEKAGTPVLCTVRVPKGKEVWMAWSKKRFGNSVMSTEKRTGGLAEGIKQSTPCACEKQKEHKATKTRRCD